MGTITHFGIPIEDTNEFVTGRIEPSIVDELERTQWDSTISMWNQNGLKFITHTDLDDLDESDDSVNFEQAIAMVEELLV